jgi:hypothetical protein
MYKRPVTLVTLAILIIAAMAPAAVASVDRFEIPITGDQFVCGSTTWTVTEGVIDVKERIVPGQHLTVSIRPVGAFAEDGDGNRVKLVGAESVSGTSKPNGEVFTTIFHLNLVSMQGGGLVGRVASVFHRSVNDNNLNVIEHSTGGCEGPIGP